MDTPLKSSNIFLLTNICQVPSKLFVHEVDRPSVQTSPKGPGKRYCRVLYKEPLVIVSMVLSPSQNHNFVTKSYFAMHDCSVQKALHCHVCFLSSIEYQQ